MTADLPFQNSLRCHATSKRTGQQCQAPAVKGWKVCRHHGAGGGAPQGERNGNYRHGQFTKEAKRQRLAVSLLLSAARETVSSV